MNIRILILILLAVYGQGSSVSAQEQHASALPIPRLGRPIEGAAGPAASGVRPLAAQENREAELSAAEIMVRCSPAVVMIRVTRPDGSSQGTGFFVSETLVATCHHVIENASRIEVTTRKGGTTYSVRVVASQPDADLAILAITGLEAPQPFLSLGDSTSVAVGAPVMAVGHPLGLEYSLSGGMVSALRHTDHAGIDLIQFTAPVSTGSSGCPLIDRQGRVIGIVSLSQSSGQSLNFAVPANYLQSLLTRIRGNVSSSLQIIPPAAVPRF